MCACLGSPYVLAQEDYHPLVHDIFWNVRPPHKLILGKMRRLILLGTSILIFGIIYIEWTYTIFFRAEELPIEEGGGDVPGGEGESLVLPTDPPPPPTDSPSPPPPPTTGPLLILVDPANNLFDPSPTQTYPVRGCSLIDPGRECIITRDASLGRNATAKVYFLKTLNMQNQYVMPPRDHPGQLYFGISPEPVTYYPWLGDAKFMRQFNHTFGYPRSRESYHSGFPFGPFVWNHAAMPGGLISKQYTSRLQWPDALPPVLGTNRTGISWFAGNCYSKNKRERVVKTLMESLRGTGLVLDAMGGCMRTKSAPFQDQPAYASHDHLKTKLLEGYMFDLAFENSHCREYLSEKVWQPLIAGAIPIFFGTRDVLEFVPANESVILVSDFRGGVPELARYLLILAGNETLRYERHLSWRDRDPRTWSPGFLKEYEYANDLHMDGVDCILCHRAAIGGSPTGAEPFPPCDENP